MEESFLLNVKQQMPPWVAKIYAAQVANGSREVYERFIGELLARIQSVCRRTQSPGQLIENLLFDNDPEWNVRNLFLLFIFSSCIIPADPL